MRILHVTHQYPPHYVGGTESYTRTLARAQAADGHQVAILTRVRSAGAHRLDSCSENGVTVYRVFEPEPTGAASLFFDSYQNRAALVAFSEVAEKFAPDVVHIQHLKGLHHGIARATEVPVVVTLHDYWYYCGNAQLLRPSSAICDGPRLWLNCVDCAAHRARSALWWAAAPAVAAFFARRAACLSAVLRTARRVIAPSQFVFDAYAKHFALEGRLRLIEHGIEPLPDVPRTSKSDGRLHVLFAGGLSHPKGAHILVQALRALPEGSATLDICGDEGADPGYAAQLKAQAADLPVTFWGALDRAALAARMAASDVLAVPSLWPEAFSLIALEAQAAGLPLLVSDIGALRERVRSADDGRRVAPGDVGAWAEALWQIASDAPINACLPWPNKSEDMQSHANVVLDLYQSL